MKVLLIRHAIAAEREEFALTGRADEERPLTEAGEKKMKRVARGLRELIDRIDLIASSPLKRAQQTADVLAKQFPDAAATVVGALEPVQPYGAFVDWLTRLEGIETVAAVGHEPHLSGLAGWLLTGGEQPFFEFKKGGMALLLFEADIAPGAAQLRWLLTPAQLRALDD